MFLVGIATHIEYYSRWTCNDDIQRNIPFDVVVANCAGLPGRRLYSLMFADNATHAVITTISGHSHLLLGVCLFAAKRLYSPNSAFTVGGLVVIHSCQ